MVKPLIPLSSTPTTEPVLLIDGSQVYEDIQACADHRLGAAKNLMHSLSCIALKNGDGSDVLHVAEAVSILLHDAYDLYQAASHARGSK